MQYEEYVNECNKLLDDYKKKKLVIDIEYALSANNININDMIEDNHGNVMTVKKIEIEEDTGDCIYFGSPYKYGISCHDVMEILPKHAINGRIS